MELKTYFAQDNAGNIIPSPTVYLYQPGTTTIVAGLLDAAGAPLANPFTGTPGGKIAFSAPDGQYDLRITGEFRDTTLRVQFISVDGDKVAAAAASAQAAEDSAQAAAASAGDAADQGALATSAKTAAEAARDAAQLSAGVYATTAAGLAATVSGDYFSVPSADAGEYLILYLNSAGAAVEQKKYPSTGALSAISDVFRHDETATGLAYAVVDKYGRAALTVLEDGTVELSDLTVRNINGLSASDFMPQPSYQGTFDAELIYFNNYGQSLAEGSNGTITTVQEYDNIGFPARANAPASYLPLTVANTQLTTRGESPMYGALGHIKNLIQSEAGISYTQHGYQLLACNNGYGGQAIATLIKGRPEYTYSISQVQSGFNIAQTEGRTFAAGAVFWTQGESDTTTTLTDYKTRLIQLAADFDADARAITGQTRKVPLICYQTASMASKSVALAQLAAANESDLIYMACPMYQFTYYDAAHINAASSKWLGGYYGLVYKRVVIDGEEWNPVRPISHFKQGAVVNVKFHVPELPLVLDTSAIPLQTKYGFTLVDSAGNQLTISSVSLVEPDTIKVVAAATIPAGAKLRYAYGGALAKGNLRDSQGDKLTYSGNRMDNWCVIFEYDL